MLGAVLGLHLPVAEAHNLQAKMVYVFFDAFDEVRLPTGRAMTAPSGALTERKTRDDASNQQPPPKQGVG